MTILGLQLARPRFHGFSNKFCSKNDHFGAPADKAQISLIFNQIIIEELPFWGSSWPGPVLIDFQTITQYEITVKHRVLATARSRTLHFYSYNGSDKTQTLCFYSHNGSDKCKSPCFYSYFILCNCLKIN